MQKSATHAEPRAQAISWLVSQLQWEQALGELRHERSHDDRARAVRAA